MESSRTVAVLMEWVEALVWRDWGSNTGNVATWDGGPCRGVL